MRHPLTSASWWVPGLLSGTVFGVLMSLSTRSNHAGSYGGGAAGLVIGALVYGVPFGLIMGWVVTRTRRDALEAAGVVDPGEMAVAGRAASRGPVPTDPRLRAAALDLATQRLQKTLAERTFTLIGFGVLTLVFVVGAIVVAPWWALGAVAFAGLLAYTALLPARLERRIDLLRAP